MYLKILLGATNHWLHYSYYTPWTIHYSIITNCLSKYVRTCKCCWGQPTAGSIITKDNKLFHNKKQTVYMYLQMLLRATNCRLHYCYYTLQTIHNKNIFKNWQLCIYVPANVVEGNQLPAPLLPLHTTYNTQ